MDLITEAKKKAAIQAVENHAKSGQIIGIGSGSTVAFAVEHLGQKYHDHQIKNIVCVPSSFQAKQLIFKYKLPYGEINQYSQLDIDIDGADEIDDQLNLIKGGGGCHLQEKIIASAAKELIIIADYRKDSHFLGEKWKKGVPLEVSPLAYELVLLMINQMGGKGRVRMANAKAGPLVSDNGNFIIDADFGVIENPSKLHQQLLNIPGVLETGLFINRAIIAYIGTEDGTVSIKKN